VNALRGRGVARLLGYFEEPLEGAVRAADWATLAAAQRLQSFAPARR
jgi:hypothetical protein